jgi:hypothetical protein
MACSSVGTEGSVTELKWPERESTGSGLSSAVVYK